MTHSPEPWNSREYACGELASIVDASGNMIASVERWKNDSTLLADSNVDRIVACVNACDGIPTEDLDWVSVKERLPKEDGGVMIFAPSADPEKPLVTKAWYDPNYGWSMLPPNWINAITHWRSLPKNRPTE